jgi:Domain of unknown function (DUF4389)
MATYGVTFDIDRQERHDRTQLVLRLLVLIVLSVLAGSLGWAHFGPYLALPVLGAILISQKGAKRYHAEAGENVTLWLRYAMAFYAYAWLLTDRLPNEDPRQTLRFEITPSGEPTVGSVLLRIITGIPHVIVLALLGIVAFILAFIAAIMILVGESYPEGIFNFLRGFVRWQARLYAYMAGLVDEYPPFAFDTGPESVLQLPPGDASQPQAP